jgi:hypothetical protein
MSDEHIDGNGIAGLLAEIGAGDMTSAMRTCQSCGDRQPVGAHRAYRTAGVVLRCPTCQDVAMMIGVQERRLLVEWRGTFELGRVDAAPG